MSRNITAFWHKASFDQLMTDRLPQLLADRLPLNDCHFVSTGSHTCQVKISLATSSGNVEVVYTDIPCPDEEGVFKIDGEHYVIVPIASHEELDTAEIKCVGEQFYDNFKVRLEGVSSDLPWSASLLKSWMPLDTWVRELILDGSWNNRLQERNWLDKHTHLRRVRVLWREKVYNPAHFGRVCPFEMPEGPSVGTILSIAVGAEIRDGKLVIIDNQPEGILGLTATMMPFLEHNDANRQLMGVNMMRQCFIPPDPEPALVQTGNEPNVPDFWYGRNVLTAYVSWGVDTFEDAIIMSESCAGRFNYPHPVEPGDKFANRHGVKGCVTRILPDKDMPHLLDGTPVELVYSFMGLQTRMTLGQLREAIMSRIARAEGKPAIVPPFQAPSREELRKRLKDAGLPKDGMETLTLGRNGKKLQRPSLVGWVYWGTLYHIAREKIAVSTGERAEAQSLGNAEYLVLRDLGAFETLKDRFNTCSAERPDANTLASRLAAGKIQQAGPPTPMFSNLMQRLAIAGIRAELNGENLAFRFAHREGKVLKLAHPIPHPWLRSQTLNQVGVFESTDTGGDESKHLYHDGMWWVGEKVRRDENSLAAYQALVEVNERAERMLATSTPQSLTSQTLNQLEVRVREYLDTLVSSEHMRFHTPTLFSGRAVIEPDIDLRHDQVGIPDKMAWTLFGPFVTRIIGSDADVNARTQKATQILDEIMEHSWVILYRAPALMPTSFLAFHPIRHEDNALHIDPIVCGLMNADFDGDQAALFLPVTAEGQREAGELLSVAGHFKRTPGLLTTLLPANESMLGLVNLSRTPAGRQEISRLAGTDVATTAEGFATKKTLADAMREVLKREGVNKTLDRLENLMHRGFELAKESGMSMSPFIGESLQRTPPPEDADEETWDAYTEELIEQLATRKEFDDNDLGPQLLAIKSGARGRMDSLSQIVVRWNSSHFDRPTPPKVRHGYRDGLTSDELRAIIHRHWEGLARVVSQQTYFGEGMGGIGGGFTVLGRAMRAKRPGIVFALAAATEDVERLVDVDSRLFVGLPVKGDG
ncbi:hypothetical protein IH992_02535 [Candidatus Poribacteria bacterium]|nr:hypothetical protein [Candidatus Poribacteria bacterium]